MIALLFLSLVGTSPIIEAQQKISEQPLSLLELQSMTMTSKKGDMAAHMVFLVALFGVTGVLSEKLCKPIDNTRTQINKEIYDNWVETKNPEPKMWVPAEMVNEYNPLTLSLLQEDGNETTEEAVETKVPRYCPQLMFWLLVSVIIKAMQIMSAIVD
eukprot:c2554_g1_i1.p1 GENE.c2554_g1_i1~~c2554_g1_i1.p1  ORF type:complete len:157 (+),score=40.69 c2554_g1_i1:41-511(+)